MSEPTEGSVAPQAEQPVGESATSAQPASTSAGASDPNAERDAAHSTASDLVAELTAERDRLRDQLLRTSADFDNFRKRTRRDLEEAERRGSEEVLRQILPVIDNLERAVEAARTAPDARAVAEGVQMVLRMFEETARGLGLVRVRAVGERFDPAMHDALQQVETDEQPPGTVLAEIEAGYQFGGRLLRAARVVVARPRRATDGPRGEDAAAGGDPPTQVN
ncbi:MAG: nucleotide exchange factor GrpE [Myxococcota bacterium]|nr:nucleotide exchange factor GrpE [Myxococcota bacterium]MDW8362498.1 nucleotide exchange factor GrpE [Myxococcales bacterium]